MNMATLDINNKHIDSSYFLFCEKKKKSQKLDSSLKLFP